MRLLLAKPAVENIFVFTAVPQQYGGGLVGSRLSKAQTFGRNHVEGIALNYGWQMKYEVRSGLAVGIEGFGVAENSIHQAGQSKNTVSALSSLPRSH